MPPRMLTNSMPAHRRCWQFANGSFMKGTTKGECAMKSWMYVVASTLVLAACNKGPEVHETNASVNEVAGKVRAAAAQEELIRPGEWESNTTVEEFSIPGMPAQFQEQMKKVMASNQMHSFKKCVTEAEVKRPKEDFFAGKNNNCRYDHFDMGGGKIDAVMNCSAKEGQQKVALNGTYSPESYDIHMQMSGQAEGMGGTMSMKSHTVSHRVGECTGKDDED